MALTDAERQALIDVIDHDNAKLFKDLYEILSTLAAGGGLDPWPDQVINMTAGSKINSYSKDPA